MLLSLCSSQSTMYIFFTIVYGIVDSVGVATGLCVYGPLHEWGAVL